MSEAGAVAAPISCCKLRGSAHDSVQGSGQETCAASSPSAKESAISQPTTASHCSSSTEELSDQFYDYSNGGPRFVEQQPAGGSSDHSTCEVIAQYCDFAGAAAAVVCSVGKGQAVLCGTHPELAPHWLGSADAPIDKQDSDAKVQCADRAETVKSKLQQTQGQRQQFWAKLMKAAGLEQYLAS